MGSDIEIADVYKSTVNPKINMLLMIQVGSNENASCDLVSCAVI